MLMYADALRREEGGAELLSASPQMGDMRVHGDHWAPAIRTLGLLLVHLC